MSRVELRNVKELRENSEETMCFHASVVIDGKVVGTVSNDGRGGAHRYCPPSIESCLVDILGAPRDGSRLDERTQRVMSTEVAVNDLVADALNRRDMRRALASRVVVENDKGEIRETKRFPRGHVLSVARTFVGRPGIARVLNLMPEDEAIALMLGKAGCRP
jgi:hypothetical protein